MSKPTENIDQLFRERFADHAESSYHDGLWSDFEQQLDAQPATAAGANKSGGLSGSTRWMTFFGGFAILVGLAAWLFWGQQPDTEISAGGSAPTEVEAATPQPEQVAPVAVANTESGAARTDASAPTPAENSAAVENDEAERPLEQADMIEPVQLSPTQFDTTVEPPSSLEPSSRPLKSPKQNKKPPKDVIPVNDKAF